MPLYEYRCERCGGVFEVMQKFSDAPLQVHEGCGGKVERLISPPALQFKGSGWYVTDYGRKSNGDKPEAKPKTEPAGDKGAKKSESAAKPASPASSPASDKKS